MQFLQSAYVSMMVIMNCMVGIDLKMRLIYLVVNLLEFI